MTAPSQAREVDYLLVGAGLASASAAEAIRTRDPNGGVLIVGDEPIMPYNRPPLSKEYLRGEIGAEGVYGSGGIFVHEPSWYDERHIELLQGRAEALDTRAHTLRLADGQVIHYGKLLLATGGHPRRLDIPGMDLPGVYTLRTLDDADALREAMKGASELPEALERERKVVVIGSGFIGLEVAANMRFRKALVTLVAPEDGPWDTMLPTQLAEYLRDHFERRGTGLRYNHNAVEFVPGDDGRVAMVRVMPEERSAAIAPDEIPCDLVVVAVGLQLNTELARQAGLEVDDTLGIVVDDHLRASAPDVYAAGDVAAYPDPIAGRMRFEHWDNAIATGKTAGANMAGADVPFEHVPELFSDMFNLAINLIGYPTPSATVAVRGPVEDDAFTGLFVVDGVLRAALLVNTDERMDLLCELIAAQAPVGDPGRLTAPDFDLASLRPRPASAPESVGPGPASAPDEAVSVIPPSEG